MIKCTIRSGKKSLVKADGDFNTLTHETMLIAREIYQEMKKENEDAAEEFRQLLFAFLIDPNSPMFKNYTDSEQPEKSPE